MEIGGWLAEHNALIGILTGSASLCFTAVALLSDAKTRRVANLIAVTANHRELWKIRIENKELRRVRDPKADVTKEPVTDEERIFVNLVLQHASSVYQARSKRLVTKFDGMRSDIAGFVSLPIPREVWKEVRPFQNEGFVEFVEESEERKRG